MHMLGGGCGLQARCQHETLITEGNTQSESLGMRRQEWQRQQPLRSGSVQHIVKMAAFEGLNFWVDGPACGTGPSLYLSRSLTGAFQLLDADAPTARPVRLALKTCQHQPRLHWQRSPAAHCGRAMHFCGCLAAGDGSPDLAHHRPKLRGYHYICSQRLLATASPHVRQNLPRCSPSDAQHDRRAHACCDGG